MFERVLIIAEAGINHNGSVETALKMIDVAKRCGADVVKFQTAKLDSLVSENAEMADYQKNNIGKDLSQKDMLRRYLLNFEDFIVLRDYCDKAGIEFLSTPFDIESIHFLNSLQNIWKIPSGEITNYPYLIEIAKTKKDIILSTGMSTLEEVRDAVNVLDANGAGDISILHCTTAYPTEYKDVNLNAMITIGKELRKKVGYSDHTNGIEIPCAAVALGAKVIEKHFTLDRSMEGPDHKASLEPDELKKMIDSIRNIETALGDGCKTPCEEELENLKVARKSIVASVDISKGEILSEENITTKRPGIGINPMFWNEVVGMKAVRDFKKDELIEV